MCYLLQDKDGRDMQRQPLMKVPRNRRTTSQQNPTAADTYSCYRRTTQARLNNNNNNNNNNSPPHSGVGRHERTPHAHHPPHASRLTSLILISSSSVSLSARSLYVVFAA